ncbi:MAG TPA: VCBS repeat-containing protein, partial [Opitutaceae bacterium]
MKSKAIPIFACAVAAAIAIVGWFALRSQAPEAAADAAAVRVDTSIAYDPVPIGAPVGANERPLVTNVAIADLDGDGLPDVLYCEALNNTVRWIRQSPRGVFTEQIIGEGIAAPAHVAVADVNRTGRLDVLVAGMGQLMPNNDLIGSVIVLENLGDRQFEKRVLLENVARVTDVRAANLSGRTDGKLDLVVGQFGYAQGEIRWMRNLGGWRFESTKVSMLSGTIHTPVADCDGDGTADFAALISQ